MSWTSRPWPRIGTIWPSSFSTLPVELALDLQPSAESPIRDGHIGPDRADELQARTRPCRSSRGSVPSMTAVWSFSPVLVVGATSVTTRSSITPGLGVQHRQPTGQLPAIERPRLSLRQFAAGQEVDRWTERPGRPPTHRRRPRRRRSGRRPASSGRPRRVSRGPRRACPRVSIPPRGLDWSPCAWRIVFVDAVSLPAGGGADGLDEVDLPQRTTGPAAFAASPNDTSTSRVPLDDPRRARRGRRDGIARRALTPPKAPPRPRTMSESSSDPFARIPTRNPPRVPSASACPLQRACARASIRPTRCMPAEAGTPMRTDVGRDRTGCLP